MSEQFSEHVSDSFLHWNSQKRSPPHEFTQSQAAMSHWHQHARKQFGRNGLQVPQAQPRVWTCSGAGHHQRDRTLPGRRRSATMGSPRDTAPGSRVDRPMARTSSTASHPQGLRTAAGALLAAGIGLAACGAPAPGAAVEAIAPDTVRFPARVNARGFEEGDMAGYHAVVWRGGRAAGAALFQAEVTDLQVLDALESLGAEPGNALTQATWSERNDPGSPAPDRVLAGPAVEVLVELPGEDAPLPLGEILSDPGGRGLAMRFGGHRELIPQWRSGCVVCLYSCPGSKVGNARYTVRDWVQGATRFTVRPGILPPDGTTVQVLLRLTGDA